MEYSWHHHPPPPPPGGAPLHGPICPVCSISHFPFCPPPLPYNHPIHQYPPAPRPDQFYPRPPALPPPPTPPQPAPPAAPYDPFVDHRTGPGMNPYPQPADPQRSWSASSGFDRDPYGNLYPGFDYSNVGAKRMAFDDSGNVGAKRIRSDNSYLSTGPPDPYMNENFVNSSRVSAENERRLKLIRDHGGIMTHEVDRNLDPKADMGFKASNNSEAGYSNFERKGTYLDQENGLNMQKSGEEQFRQQPRNHADSGSHKSNIYGCSGHPTDNYNNTKQPRQSREAMGYNWQGVSGSSSVYSDHKGGFPSENRDVHNKFSQKYTTQHHIEPKLNHYGSPYLEKQGDSLRNQSGISNGLAQDSRFFSGQPPLPASPPPPLPMEPPGPHLSDPLVTPGTSASLFPIPVASSAVAPSSYLPHSEASSLSSAYYPNIGHLHASTGFGSEEFQAHWQAPPKIYLGGGNEVAPLQPLSPEKPKIIDVSHIIKHPHRATRPDHIVIILRGLPGSGKSYLAKMLRDLEVENGGSVPRIHCMDDYFMTEVEKIEEIEVSKSSGFVKGKKQVTKKVIEYCYEPEMEEAYRSSMLKAFKKTLDEGVFSFIIVDDRNLRVADFAQFWATAKRSGYEVYLLEAMYKDPVGCAARNVHGFSQDDIQKMADLWEEAPSLYLRLDIKSLLHGDGLEEGGIQEVDMDMEDGDPVEGISVSEERNIGKVVVPHAGELASDGHLKGHERWVAEADHQAEEVKELGKSKWSNDLDEDDIHRREISKGNSNALSGLIKSYNKEGKSVRWGDEVSKSGFSIAAAKTANMFTLVIGPGAGYNLKSNPLSEEEKRSSHNMEGSKKQNVFHERLRAEQESFRAVFDKRRQRIGGLAAEDD